MEANHQLQALATTARLPTFLITLIYFLLKSVTVFVKLASISLQHSVTGVQSVRPNYVTYR